MINTLPEDITRYIYSFIPYHIKCLLSAKNYEKYNKYHLGYMNEFVYGNKLKLGKKFTFDTYVRRLIKNDYYYVFKFVLLDNFKSWKKSLPIPSRSRYVLTYYLNCLVLIHSPRMKVSHWCGYSKVATLLGKTGASNSLSKSSSLS